MSFWQGEDAVMMDRQTGDLIEEPGSYGTVQYQHYNDEDVWTATFRLLHQQNAAIDNLQTQVNFLAQYPLEGRIANLERQMGSYRGTGDSSFGEPPSGQQRKRSIIEILTGTGSDDTPTTAVANSPPNAPKPPPPPPMLKPPNAPKPEVNTSGMGLREKMLHELQQKLAKRGKVGGRRRSKVRSKSKSRTRTRRNQSKSRKGRSKSRRH